MKFLRKEGSDLGRVRNRSKDGRVRMVEESDGYFYDFLKLKVLFC